MHGDGARDGAQHEPARERQHVDDHDVLERSGVQGLQADVGERHAGERQAERRRERERGRPDRQRRCRGRADRERARGNRPLRFQRMTAIAAAIGDVVHQVDDTGQRAEDGEGDDRVADRGRIEEPAAEEQAGEYQQVLRPLPRPERDEEVDGDSPPRHSSLERRGRSAGDRHVR